jgi:DNA topoisomerase-1
MTSTLQQEAGRKLRFSAARTMQAAQRLYESGFITYMRTDSVALSDVAIRSAREHIRTLYGDAFLPERPRTFFNKVKNAQEAHEAIRPAGDVFQRPEVVARSVGDAEAKLYELIWMRAVASQMADARGERVQVQIEAEANGKVAELSVSGNTITFPGFLRAYVEGSDDPEDSLAHMERPLPDLHTGELLDIGSAVPRRHETQPPARFTEASLVRDLEAKAVGRPSTFASILGTIQDRGYVWKKGTALVPSFTAFSVVTLLEQHFPVLVDYEFTARMEDDLDAIAHGTQEMVPWLGRFYFGSKPGTESDGTNHDLAVGLRALVSDNLGEIDARAINSLHIGEGPSGDPIIVRVGRYGPYILHGNATASVPEDLPPDEVTVDKALSLLATAQSERKLGEDPTTGLDVWLRMGRFGAYVQLGSSDGDEEDKPKRASLFRSMDPESVTLENALALLSLPRFIGQSDGEPVEAHNGRYGPYVVKGKERRSLDGEEQIFSISLEGALALLAQPNHRARRASAEPLRELGKDPVSQGVVTVREGRFGPYVTDGETNASLRKGDTVDGITLERAAELLVARRERVAANPKKPRKAAAKKTTKKAAAKKTTKKATTKKTTKKATAKKTTKKAAAKKATKKTTKKATAGKVATDDSASEKTADKAAASKPIKEMVRKPTLTAD